MVMSGLPGSGKSTVAIIALEHKRCLKGDLRPAIRGERNPGTALTRSLRTLAARLFGGETREYEQKTPVFRVP